MDARIRYLSFRVRPTEAWNAKWKLLLLTHQPGIIHRGGGMISVENGESLVTLYGTESENVDRIRNWESACSFAESLRSDLLFDALLRSQATTPFSSFRRTENRFRNFSEASVWPKGLVVVGDSLCALNPIYGHGMTVVLLQALSLSRMLKNTNPADKKGFLFSKSHQRKLEKIARWPYQLACGADQVKLGGDAVKKRNIGAKMGAFLIRKLGEAATSSIYFRELSREVMHLEKSVGSLLHPKLLVRLLLARPNSLDAVPPPRFKITTP